jgi:hypothetical protein
VVRRTLREAIAQASREQGRPVCYLKERRVFAEARKAASVEVPLRRNRVWQIDFSGFGTIWSGTCWICCVVDYASKCMLSAHLSATAKARVTVAALRRAVAGPRSEAPATRPGRRPSSPVAILRWVRVTDVAKCRP